MKSKCINYLGSMPLSVSVFTQVRGYHKQISQHFCVGINYYCLQTSLFFLNTNNALLKHADVYFLTCILQSLSKLLGPQKYSNSYFI